MAAGQGVIWDRPERSSRGPAPTLTRERIAAVAVALADEQGMDQTSMRALAAELGVGAASLYRYVARKDQLVDLMVDAVMGSDLAFEVSGYWRDDMRGYARAARDMTLRHPWIAAAGAGRTSIGPNTAERYEQGLSMLGDLGLTIDDMLVMIETVNAFVRGRALVEIAEREAIRRSGLNQDQWMDTQAPHIERLIESGRYPLLTQVVIHARAPHDPNRLGRDFDIGLERLLDGLSTMLPD